MLEQRVQLSEWSTLILTVACADQSGPAGCSAPVPPVSGQLKLCFLLSCASEKLCNCGVPVVAAELLVADMVLNPELLSVVHVVAGVTSAEMLVWCNVDPAAEVAVATGLASVL